MLTVRTETVTEFSPERAGPVILRLLKQDFFRLIAVICPPSEPEICWKRYLIPESAYPATKSERFEKLIPGSLLDQLSFWCGLQFGRETVCASASEYSQHLQNYLNKYFRAKVGKELPQQFPEPPPVGKLGVGNLALSCAATTLEAKKSSIIRRRLNLGNRLPDILLKKQ